MFVQETKWDYCRLSVAFKSDHLYMVLKLSIVLGDASDKNNTAFSSGDRMAYVQLSNCRVVFRHWSVICTHAITQYVQCAICPSVLSFY